jgi:hypothetical protein
MRRLVLISLVVLLPACGDAAPGGPTPSPDAALPGIHRRIAEVDVWVDSLPDRRFEVVRGGVALPPDPETGAPLFPAARVEAAAEMARELEGDAAMIRTRISSATAADPFGMYSYEVDIVRYPD